MLRYILLLTFAVSWPDLAMARQTVPLAQPIDATVPSFCRPAKLPNNYGDLGLITTARRGELLIPPRDYTRHDALPPEASGDPKGNGNYDIAFLGVQQGDIMLELRDYGYGDLTRPAVSRHLSFPVGQRQIRIRQITLHVTAATVAKLSYRVTVDPAANVLSASEPNECPSTDSPLIESPRAQ